MGEWITAALGILTIVTAAGAGLSGVYVRDLRARVLDLRGEIEDKDRRLSRAEADVLAERAERKIQATEIAALQRLVGKDDKVDALRIDGEAHHAAAVEHWKKEQALLSDIRNELRKAKP